MGNRQSPHKHSQPASRFDYQGYPVKPQENSFTNSNHHPNPSQNNTANPYLATYNAPARTPDGHHPVSNGGLVSSKSFGIQDKAIKFIQVPSLSD